MGPFFVTLVAAAVLLFTAVPGYLMIKKKMLSERCMPDLSKILLYVCQPCLVIYAFSSATFSLKKLVEVGLFVLLALVIQGVMLGLAVLVLHRKFKDTAYRIISIATTFANCGFFGIPIIEALMPDVASEVIIFTTVYALTMNVLGWTVASAIISGDTRYISVKKILINPAMISTLIALPIFALSVSFPTELESMITIIGRMSTPISMFIMGMRLASTELKSVFCSPRCYAACAMKLFVMPLLAFLLALALPIATEVKQTFFIVTACPSASIVLNFSELVGKGQREAAGMVLLTTILSVVSLPIMMLFLPLL